MSSADPPPTSRREELAARLAAVHERIERAKAAAGRGDDELGLVVVTKFFPASDVDLLAELGVSAIGENRDQEASAKVARLVHRDSLAVHFIGQLQSNKARSVATYADVVQSLDRPKVVRALDRAAEAHGRHLDVTVQVGLDGEAGRGGRPAARRRSRRAVAARMRPGARRPLLLPSRRGHRTLRRGRRAGLGVSDVGAPGQTARRAELAASLAAVHARIDTAMADAGRTDPVSLVVVTKLFPASDVDLLAGLGVTDIGENRDQEASAKVARLAHRELLTVHFIGQLQSNKAASVAHYADVVQSVDRAKVARALDRAAGAAGRVLDVTVQVSLDPTPGRGGVAPDEAAALADLVAASPALRLRGVMAVAPLGVDPRPAFARLREVGDGIRTSHPGATWVSAGMSGDLEAAVAEGATHLRVGSAILGSRQSHR